MKRLVLCMLIIVCFAAPALAQEGEKEHTGSISFVLANSWAPIGIGAEFFLGQIGLGATFTTFVIGGGDGGVVFVLDPGAYCRLYFGDISSAFYLMGGVAYLTAVGTYEGDVEALDFGLFKVNAAVGYNAILGKKENARFSIEMGPRYRMITDPDADVIFPLLMHFMLMFGTVF
jgi:hypothetical protein